MNIGSKLFLWRTLNIINNKMKVNAVLVDLSGTLHIEDTEIPGSIQAVKRYGYISIQTLKK